MPTILESAGSSAFLGFAIAKPMHVFFAYVYVRVGQCGIYTGYKYGGFALAYESSTGYLYVIGEPYTYIRCIMYNIIIYNISPCEKCRQLATEEDGC